MAKKPKQPPPKKKAKPKTKPKKKQAAAKPAAAAVRLRDPIEFWDDPTVPLEPNRDIAELVAEVIRTGAHVITAFRALGIPAWLVRKWVAQAVDEPTSRAAALFRVVDAAEARLESALTSMLPGAPHATGTTFLLQKRFPHWGDAGSAMQAIDERTPRKLVEAPQLPEDEGAKVLAVLKDLKIVTTTAQAVEEGEEDDDTDDE